MTTFRVMGCPFCGEAPTITPWHGGGKSKTAIRCDNDDCAVAPMVTGSTGDSATTQWNRRSLPMAEYTVEKTKRD